MSVVDAWVKKTGNRLTKKQKAEIEAGRVIASEIGIDVKYVVNFQDANGKKVGMIDPVTGKITGANGEISFREETGKIEMILDINAGLSNFSTKEGQASILRAMSHELTHFIEKMSPRMYQDLQEFMIQNIDFGEDSFHGLVAQKMESLKIGETQAVREVIANACETMLGDSDVMTKLYQQNAGLGDRIRSWLSKKIQSIDRAIARIREIFRKAAEGDTAQYAESKALTANLEGYRQALQKWETALLDAAQNYQNGGLIVLDENVKYSDRESFSEQVDQVLDGTFDKETSHVYVGETPTHLISLGIKPLPMLITANHVYSIAVSEDQAKTDGRYRKNTHYHDLGNMIKKLPEAIQNPVMILKSNRDPANTDIVLVTNLKDQQNRPIIAAVKVNGNGNYAGIEIKTNLIASTYSKDNFNNYLQVAVNEKRVLFYDKKRSQELLNTPGVYFPNNIQSLDFGNSIAQYRASVNNQYTQNSKINSEQSVKYSEREYSYEELTAKPDMKVTEIDDSVTYTANSETRKQIVSQAIKNAASVGYTNENGNAVVHVKDIDTDVILTKKSLVHGLDRRMSTQAPVLVKIGEVLENAIKINEMLPRAENIKSTYALISSAYGKDGNIYAISFIVNKYSNEISEIDVLYAANAKKESAALLPKFTDKSATPTDSTISISQLLETVNRYFPDILPESVLRHFGHETRPDGTLGQSALYSERESNVSREIFAKALQDAVLSKEERTLVKEYQKQVDDLYQLYKELNVYYKEAVDSNQTYRPALDQDYRRHLEKQISSLQEKIKEKKLKVESLEHHPLLLKTMQPIRDIIEKEKRAAARASAEKHKKKVFEKEYREKKIRKIQTTVKRINRLLTKPNGTKNVKDGLQKESMKFMQTFLNNTSVFNKKQLERLSEFYKKIDGGEEVNSGNTGVYNEDIQNTIDELKQTIAGKRLSQLSKEELEKTGELVDHFSHIIKTENEVFIMISRIRVDSFSKIWYNK